MSVLLSFIAGVVGWFAIRFVFDPYREIADLRREAQEALIIYGNLSRDAPADERRIAADAFRRVGAALVARHVAAYPWVRRLCQAMRWDIHSAGVLLIGLGNLTQFDGYSMASISPPVANIRTCLRLPSPEKPPMIAALEANARAPASSDEPPLW